MQLNRRRTMPKQLTAFDKTAAAKCVTEPDVEMYANSFLNVLGFHLKTRKTGNKDIDKHWPSKTATARGPGAPDLLLYADASQPLPFCVWENKSSIESVTDAINDAKFYIEGLHAAKAGHPGLPRLAAGFNGKHLRLAYFNHEKQWHPVRANGVEVADSFPIPHYAAIGFSSNGNFLAAHGHATAADLRKVLPTLKNIYRGIPTLSSGRRPIDFTVALLTLRMLCEMLPAWGTWAEQPGLIPDAESNDYALKERFAQLLTRIVGNKDLKSRYGDIFEFKEKAAGANAETAFSFEDCIKHIDGGEGFYEAMYLAIDTLPPLHGADFDVFGEVYQAIGDDATKKSLGEFFTGRHIISAVVPLLFERAGITSFDNILANKTVADIACGTGGFLTEFLRFSRKKFTPSDEKLKDFAQKAFFGYDLSQSNASRARVNMYFAGDGFSTITGGVNSLGSTKLYKQPADGFDIMLANPPYGQRLEEEFLTRIVALLKQGTGWGLVVLPTGVLENPRSAPARLALMRNAKVTDVIALPPHAFAPYTKQRTAIIIFQKRVTPLVSLNWKDLSVEVGNEEISMFIVDNDGFANSDKRYETARRAKSGEWLHNDLAGWVHATTGKYHDSKLMMATLTKKTPKPTANEFGVPLGKKYGIFTIKQLFKRTGKVGPVDSRSISLLPDSFLRPSFSTLTIAEFRQQCELINSIVLGGPSPTTALRPLSDWVREILATPLVVVKPKKLKVKDVFEIKKGDSAVTESVIYAQFEPSGLPVYGGGEALPRFKISKTSKTKKGTEITVHAGPALIVAMDGSSGAVRVVETGEFCSNHHASVLKPKAGFSLDLYAVAQQLEGGLRELSSNKAGSATLTLPVLEEFELSLPTDAAEIAEMIKQRKLVVNIRDRFFGA